jgi:hypothetical protein
MMLLGRKGELGSGRGGGIDITGGRGGGIDITEVGVCVSGRQESNL